MIGRSGSRHRWRSVLGVGIVAVVSSTGCGGGARPDASHVSLAPLRKRPLDLPHIRLHGGFSHGVPGRCFSEVSVGATALPGIPGEAALGPTRHVERGPVYVAFPKSPPRFAGTGPFGRSHWWATDAIWVSRPTYNGPVLVRGGRLDRHGRVAFGLRIRHPRSALRLPAGRSGYWARRGIGTSGGLRGALRPGWRAARVPARVRTPGCYAFRVDGRSFSYVLAFAVIGPFGERSRSDDVAYCRANPKSREPWCLHPPA